MVGVGVLFAFIVLLSKEVEGRTLLDPRCGDDMFIWTVEHFLDNIAKLEIFTDTYVRTGKVVCSRTRRELPELGENDNWSHWISLIGNLTNDEEFQCAQFPQFYATAYKALNNNRLRRNCTFITSFCDSCEFGCKHVRPMAYSSREEMIGWAVDSLGMRDSPCQRNWTIGNIEQGLKRNETWLSEVREACESCYERDCTTIRAQFVNNLLMDELKKHSSDAQAVWNHMCRYPAAMGKFGYTTFNLEERFNAYDEFLQLMMAFQSNSWWCFPVVILFMILCTAFFHIPNRYRDFFDIHAHIESFKRFKADRLLQWVIKRLATKAERMRAKASKAIQRFRAALTKKPTAPTAKTSAAATVSAEPNAKSSAIPDSKKKENGGTIASGLVGGQQIEQGGLVSV